MQRLQVTGPMEFLAAEPQHDLCAFRHWQRLQGEVRPVEFSDG